MKKVLQKIQRLVVFECRDRLHTCILSLSNAVFLFAQVDDFDRESLRVQSGRNVLLGADAYGTSGVM